MSQSSKLGTRKRTVNFTERDRVVLIELVDDELRVIENKKTDAVSVSSKKEAWGRIASKFQANGGPTRDGIQLKACYEAIKLKAKKSNAEDKCSTFLTGGGSHTPTMTDSGSKLMGLLKDQLQCLASPYDSSAEYNEVQVLVEDNIEADATPIDIVDYLETDGLLLPSASSTLEHIDVGGQKSVETPTVNILFNTRSGPSIYIGAKTPAKRKKVRVQEVYGEVLSTAQAKHKRVQTRAEVYTREKEELFRRSGEKHELEMLILKEQRKCNRKEVLDKTCGDKHLLEMQMLQETRDQHRIEHSKRIELLDVQINAINNESVILK